MPAPRGSGGSSRARSRGLRTLGLVLLVTVGVGVFVWLRAPPEPPTPPETAKLPEGLLMAAVDFESLAGWGGDNQAKALTAFLQSCRRFAVQPDSRGLGAGGLAGTVADWRQVCQRAGNVLGQGSGAGAGAAARGFFEREFTPFAATNGGDPEGLFTGYYEIEIQARRDSSGGGVPLYRRPDDLVMVNLGRFREDYRGRRIAGRISAGRLVPYDSRAEIENGALGGRGLEFLWLKDPVDAFFLHVQGSGRAILPDGSRVRVGYDGDNGHSFTGIGRILIDRGILPRAQVSMQSIRAWIAANPKEGAALMAENAAFIFFHEIDGAGPLGAQGAPLTALRSLAVDRKYIPLGLPVWLEVEVPNGAPGAGSDHKLKRLFIAQDTGGAIRGPVRGDIFWGTGADAGAVAGRMKHKGRYFLLLPKAVARRHRQKADLIG